MNRRDFDDILNDCIEKVVFQGESLESCLEAHPRYRRELELLLRSAMAVRQTAQVQPRLVYKAVAGYRFEQAVKDTLDRRGSRRFLLWGWSRRWAAAALLLLLVLVSGGTVMASSEAVPNEPLYSVKATAEVFQEMLAFNEVTQAQLNIRLAENRVREIEALSRRSDAEGTAKLIQKWEQHLEKVRKAAPPLPRAVAPRPAAVSQGQVPQVVPAPRDSSGRGSAEVRAALRRSAPRQIALLEQALARHPEKERAALAKELRKLVERYQEALEEEEEPRGGEDD